MAGPTVADGEPAPFELTLYGGAPERRYRKLRPDLLRMPWEELSSDGAPPEVIAAARLGWTRAALQEYASADAQALMLRWLVRARAPLDLSAVASRFSLDELAHAELCARVAERLGGGATIPHCEEVLYATGKASQEAELEAARQVVWNCCVSESWSHAILTAVWTAEKHPLLREVRGRIAKDEAAHAQFGWIYLDWLLPDLTPEHREWLGRSVAPAVRVIEQGIDATSALGDEHFHPLCPSGGLGKEGCVSMAREALKVRVLEPLAERGIVVPRA
ncbi:MAG TPA: hypothetical protein VGH20_16195 [Myxococcales bacterium]|jgi:hypothetical protein